MTTKFSALIAGLALAMISSTAKVTPLQAADDPAKPEVTAPAEPAAKPAEAPATAAPEAKPVETTSAGAKMSPIDRVNSTEKGKLKNPYTDNPEAIAEGKKLYLGNSCNGCHGGGGGGGMCPPLTNETWVYGSDDDTLFRLITLGSADLKAKGGYKAIAKEAVTGPMPGYSEIIKDEDHLWKIIAYVRSVFGGRPEKRNW
ncbi:MAG: c-type cytochrome [Hyphomicrobium sp.]